MGKGGGGGGGRRRAMERREMKIRERELSLERRKQKQNQKRYYNDYDDYDNYDYNYDRKRRRQRGGIVAGERELAQRQLRDNITYSAWANKKKGSTKCSGRKKQNFSQYLLIFYSSIVNSGAITASVLASQNKCLHINLNLPYVFLLSYFKIP
ncbi:Hypothetical predicted protein [Paramuricea clavata]|uniref:Uncharacterized protein n=1 Tax=Paramuricea clavata TaxID=317549 RepID=A0A7D9IR50_PARCT|nr:Hypothetical predicted protein [Paramuricea clavata]